jgi:TonB-dependent SusC/RagA subfamily outer membrane receptor
MKRLTCTLLLLTCFSAFAQKNGKLTALAASLDSFNNKTPIEKIHIQFDKPYYALGDTLWMKAYVVDENNGLSSLSKIVYADLTDDKGAIKTSLKLPLTQGLGWGAITLGDSLLQEGIYHIRAYTTLMRNFDAAYFFDKTIRISSKPGPAALALPGAGALTGGGPEQAGKDSLSVQFFPEGGELVDGLFSRVAFKAIGSDGFSREVSGTIVDKDNNPVTDFRSQHAGMGFFILQPVAGNTYTAVIKLPGGGQQRVLLPAAQQQGYVLSVNQNKDNVFVSIAAAGMPGGEVTLVAQAGNVIKYSGTSDLANGGATSIIPKSRFPGGIVQFTLFSPQFQPVAERLVFIRNAGDHLNIKVMPDKAGYQTRDKVHLNVEVTSQDGKPVVGSFSMAVTDEGALPYSEADEKTIFSNLLLSADLKGYIEHPNYYFTDVNPDKDQQLDNLLLTQGWRRFVWKDILNHTLPALAYQPEGGMGLSGQVLTNKGQPSPGAKVYILFNTRGGTIIDTVADAQGRFNFDRVGFDKDLSYNISVTDAKGKKDVKVEFDKTVVVPPAVNLVPDELPMEEGSPAYAANAAGQAAGQQQGAIGRAGNDLNTPAGQKKPIALNEVTINERKEDLIKKLAFQGSSNKAGYADFKFTFIDLAKVNDMGNFLAIQTDGIKIIHGNMGQWRARSAVPPDYLPYQVIVDGKVEGADQYSSILPENIAGIEVIKDSQVNNPTGTRKPSGGSIVITLKKDGVNYSKYVDEHELDEAKAKATALAQKKAEQEKTINLKEVTIQETTENKIKKIALQDSKNPAGGAAFDDAIFTFADLAKTSDLGTFLAGHATGLRVATTTRPPGWQATYDASKMQVIVNGRPESLIEYSTITPDQIAAIEIIKGSQAGNMGSGVYGGSINITLKSGNVNYQSYIDEAEEKVQKSIMLKEISVKEKKLDASIKAVAVQFSQNLAGAGNADQVLTFIDLLGCQADLSQCLNGRLTNISFQKDATGALVPYSRGFDSPMLIVVDGVQGRSLSDVMSSDVASVEVLRGGGAATLYGMHAANGVLIITTKHGGIDYDKYEMEHYVPGYTKPTPVLVTYKFQEGYDPRREFHSPDYDNPAINKEMADQRTTIYWAPNVITDKNGKASISFFNADARGNYRVITEGLDGQGKLGRQVDRYVVK